MDQSVGEQRDQGGNWNGKETMNAPRTDNPLETLLLLIEAKKLDVTTVSLAAVTDDYLASLGLLATIPTPALAHFLVVASHLVLIKARVLAAAPDNDDEQTTPLLEQLVRYRQFRLAAQALGLQAERNGSSYVREPRWEERAAFLPPAIAAGDLRAAMRRVLRDISQWDAIPRTSIYDQISMRDVIRRLQTLLNANASFSLSEALADQQPLYRLVAFLALLEIMRQRKARAHQHAIAGAITVERLPA